MSTRPSTVVTHWEGEPTRVWAQVWGIPSLEAHGTLPSTNDRCRELAEEGSPAFTTVIADAQSAGRGRGGRPWASPAGMGLWMSTLVVASGQAGSPLTPLLLGLAVVRAVGDVAPRVAPVLKWPNDVLVGGRKLCGILCEATGTAGGIVAGIGINVRQRSADFPEELRGGATSLEMAAGDDVSRSSLAGRVLYYVRELMTAPPLQLAGRVARDIAAVDVLAGKEIVVSSGIRGIGRGIASDGSLLVLDPAGTTHAVYGGTVRVEGWDGLVVPTRPNGE